MKKDTSLRDEVRTLLLNRPASLEIKQISKDLKVSCSWLNSFGRGEIKNPGVVTVQTLGNYLRIQSQKIQN